MRKTLVFVGDTPSHYNTDPKVAFKGARCERRLKSWIKHILTPVRYHLEDYLIINRVDFMFSVIKILNVHMYAPYIIIALGHEASQACGKIEHFKLPHPSGLNRQINDKKFILDKLNECKQYVEQRRKSK